jgi:hypothetical protein
MDTDMMKLDCVCPEPGRARKLQDPQGIAKQNLLENGFCADFLPLQELPVRPAKREGPIWPYLISLKPQHAMLAPSGDACRSPKARGSARDLCGALQHGDLLPDLA